MVPKRGNDFALNQCTPPFVLDLAKESALCAFSESPHLRSGLNVHKGAVTRRAVADAPSIKFTPAGQGAATVTRSRHTNAHRKLGDIHTHLERIARSFLP